MQRAIDLNSDLGESVGGHLVADDAAMFALVTSANIACGYHAGNEATMRSSCGLAVRHGVALGAHVSYRDLEGFGRRPREIAPNDLIADVLAQLRVLARIAEDEGTSIRYVKPHGALYNRIAIDPDQADAVATAVHTFDPALPILGLAGSAIAGAAADEGLPFRHEAFVDRAYRHDGTLVPRSEPGAVLSDIDEIASRAVRMVQRGDVDAADGRVIPVEVDSLCVHGDTPDALSMARAVLHALTAAGIRMAAFA